VSRQVLNYVHHSITVDTTEKPTITQRLIRDSHILTRLQTTPCKTIVSVEKDLEDSIQPLPGDHTTAVRGFFESLSQKRGITEVYFRHLCGGL
jgi:hypothetical protein